MITEGGPQLSAPRLTTPMTSVGRYRSAWSAMYTHRHRTGAGPSDSGPIDSAHRCLALKPRLTLRQTRGAAGGQAEAPAAASRTLNVAHINPRSLLPSMDDVIEVVRPGAHWGNHKRKRSRTHPNRARSCPKRIGTVHQEKPPPFCESFVKRNET